MAERTERKIASETVLEGRIIRVTVDRVELDGGKTAVREVVHHSGGAGVAALNDKGEIALVRQYRYAAGRAVIEIPAGKIEPGENPRETAIRELAEEAGLAADRVEAFGSVLPTGAYCTERIFLYRAAGLRPVPAQPDEDECVELLWLPLDEAVRQVLDGTITDAKTVSAVLRMKLAAHEKGG